MAFRVTFPDRPEQPPNRPNSRIFIGESSYEISAAGVLTVTDERQDGKPRRRHFAPGRWFEVEDDVEVE